MLDNICNEYCSSHGPGRENGGLNILSTGCRNYIGYSFKYGAVNIPYWINMASFNQVANITHRNTMLSDIKYQLSLWDDVQINDGTGYFVNFYEVSPGKEKPNIVDGHKVIEIRQEDLTSNNWAGVFRPSEYSVSLCYDQTNKRINYNVDTIVHEFGHVLGLNDIDSANSVPSGTHKTLMSYSRGTTSTTLGKAIKYQDIQGVAVVNNIHTAHSYLRYVVRGNKYLHICLYCDRVDSRTSVISGSRLMENNSTCNHEYKEIISAGERHWFKCTKCYNVKESYQTSNITITSSNATQKSTSERGNYYELGTNKTYTFNVNPSNLKNLSVKLGGVGSLYFGTGNYNDGGYLNFTYMAKKNLSDIVNLFITSVTISGTTVTLKTSVNDLFSYYSSSGPDDYYITTLYYDKLVYELDDYWNIKTNPSDSFYNSKAKENMQLMPSCYFTLTVTDNVRGLSETIKLWVASSVAGVSLSNTTLLI